MAGEKKTIISIKEAYYAEPLTSGVLNAARVAAILQDIKTRQIVNAHDTTWVYEEAEAAVTDYKNQMNGQTYYRDYTPGTTSATISIGQYDYQTKADLQGGTATDKYWLRPETQELINKCMIYVTKDDTYIVFSKASISSRGGMVEDKVVGLILSTTPLDTGVAGLAPEGWFDGSEVKVTP